MQKKINRQARSILVILTITTVFLVACSRPDDREMLQTAKNYLDDKKIREAAIELRDALQNNPDNAEARYLLGLINLDIGDSAAAEKEFRRASKAESQVEDAQVGLARALIYAHKFQELVDEVKIKQSYSPATRANLYGLRAAAQISMGELNQATETLARGAAIDANALKLLKSTVLLRLARGDLEGSNSALQKALSVYPDNPELLLLSAIAVIGEDREDARRAYQKIIDQDPPKFFTVYGRKARLSLVRLEILEKNLDQAKSTLAPLIEISRNDPEINYQAGLVAFSQGDYASSEDYLLKVLKVVPEHSPTQLLFGTVNYAQKDYEQAAYYIAKYLNAMPENLGARKLLGRTYMMLGQANEALAILQAARNEGSGDAELLALVGLSQMQGGNTVAGIEGLEHSLKVDPENPALRRELAKAYLTAGETDHAIQQLRAMMAGSNGEEQTETLLVMAYLRNKNFDQAINTVLEILARSPNDPAVLTLAGNVFNVSHDKLEAREYFNQALQIRPGFFPAALSLASLEEEEGNIAEATVLYKEVAGADQESTVALMALARLAESQGKKKEMFAWLEQARERDPRNIKPQMILADRYLREKQIKKADLLVKDAIKSDSLTPSLLAMQCRVLMADKRYNEALPLLNELVTKMPGSIYSRVLLSETYLRLGQIKDARKQLAIILAKKPSLVPALALMTEIELQSGHYQQALEYAEKIQQIRPQLYIGYQLAGDAHMVTNEYSDAKLAYTQAWSLKPSAELAIKLAETAKRSSQPEEATVALLAWLKSHPDDAKVLQFLGANYQGMGRNDKAMQAYEKALRAQPDNIVALNNLAWLYALSNNPEALSLAERAYQESPDNAGIQDTYGWLLVLHGQFDKGRGLLKQAMDKLPKVAEVRYHYAVALLKSGKKEEAHKRLKELSQSEDSFEGKEDINALLKGL